MENDVLENRRINIGKLIDQLGSIAALNKKCGRQVKDSTFSIIRNKIGGRTCGARVARGLEQALSLPTFWLDEAHMDGEFQRKDSATVRIREMLNPASCGFGANSLEHDVIVGDINLSKEFIRRLNITTNSKLSVITGYGDSMSPTINNGDKVLVDESRKDFSQGGVFVIRAGEKNFIKRITVSMMGKPQISCDNPNVKLAEELLESSEILGKVIYVWHGTAL